VRKGHSPRKRGNQVDKPNRDWQQRSASTHRSHESRAESPVPNVDLTLKHFHRRNERTLASTEGKRLYLRVGDEVNHLRYEQWGLGVVTEVMTSSIPGGTCLARVRFQDGQLRCFRLGYRTVRYSDTDVALFLRSRMSVIEGGKPEETMQPKTAEYWRAQGYQLSPLQTHCPACQAAVDVWAKPNRHESTARLMVLVDPRTFEPHWAGCPNAKQFRTEQQRQAGRL